jgi:hypothetical protein
VSRRGVREVRTPQKKCRMKIINTLFATFGPEYRFLKGTGFPSWSRMLKFSILLRSAWVGRLLLVLTSPWKFAVLSTCVLEEAVESEEVLEGAMFVVHAFTYLPFVDVLCEVVEGSLA